nr:l-2,4-diaminobutyrate decarboxylase [Quercus suber]
MATSTPPPSHVLPSIATLERARSSLFSALPESGLPFQETRDHLTRDIVPALNQASRSPNYYGFVTGGATPIAALADNIVTEYDQNVQVHLPQETIATDVEDAALRMLTDLLRLDAEQWRHRTFTTGATASNVLGLACGREFVVQEAARQLSVETSVAEHGMMQAMKSAQLDNIQILSTVPHSSLRKAASIVGLGRSAVIDVSLTHAPHRFDLAAVRAALQKPHTASIIVISCAEVNTGLFATTLQDLRTLRELCTQHHAWIHVDAAFGLLARVLSAADAPIIAAGVAGLELADSITGDAHKLLNVPYDCGIFLSRDLGLATAVFQNPAAAYLAVSSAADETSTIPSPLNIGLENSRRFRALPVYANLLHLGRAGFRAMLLRQIALSRAIARYILRSPAWQLLPQRSEHDEECNEDDETSRLQATFIIVLFRAQDPALNAAGLVRRINASRRLYVSGTQWEGQPAARFAVSNWQADPERDRAIVGEVLDEVVETWAREGARGEGAGGGLRGEEKGREEM